MASELDLDAIEARYSKALDAKPGKGDISAEGIAAITDSVCDIPDLIRELRRRAARDAEAWETGLNTGIGYKTALDMIGPDAPEPVNPYALAGEED